MSEDGGGIVIDTPRSVENAGLVAAMTGRPKNHPPTLAACKYAYGIDFLRRYKTRKEVRRATAVVKEACKMELGRARAVAAAAIL